MEALKYEVVAHGGVGPVRLEMTRTECRAAMPEPPHGFRKSDADGRTFSTVGVGVSGYFADT